MWSINEPKTTTIVLYFFKWQLFKILTSDILKSFNFIKIYKKRKFLFEWQTKIFFCIFTVAYSITQSVPAYQQHMPPSQTVPASQHQIQPHSHKLDLIIINIHWTTSATNQLIQEILSYLTINLNKDECSESQNSLTIYISKFMSTGYIDFTYFEIILFYYFVNNIAHFRNDVAKSRFGNICRKLEIFVDSTCWQKLQSWD